MSGLLVAVTVIAVLPIILIRPHVGILAWFWLAFMNPHQISWGPLSELPFAKICAIFTIIGFIFSKERKAVPVNTITVTLAIFAVWITFTTFFAQAPGPAFQDWSQAIKIMLTTFLAIALINTRERVQSLVWVVVICIGLFGINGGLFTLLTGGAHRIYGPPNTMIADNNHLAGTLVMTLPLMFYLVKSSAHRGIQVFLLCAMALTFFSVLGSHSRGGFLALAIMGMFLIMKSRYRFQLGSAALVMSLVAIAFVPTHWTERMATIEEYEEDASASARLQVWGMALEVAQDRPITGAGFNAYYDTNFFMSYIPDAVKARNYHSIYFEVLGEHGIVGFVLFTILGTTLWLRLWRIMRMTRDRSDLRWAYDLAAMSQVSLVGYGVAGAFLNLAFFDLPYVILAIGVATDAIVRASIVPENQPSAGRGRGALARRPRANTGTAGSLGSARTSGTNAGLGYPR